ASHPGGGPGHRAEHPELPAGHQCDRTRARRLPAAAVRRVRGPVRLGRRRAGPRLHPAAPEGRMSATAQARRPRPKASRSGPRRAGMPDALHAEWTKLRTVSGPAWLLLGVVALTAAVGAAADGATHCPAGLSCPVDPTKLSLTGIQFSQAVVAILAV